MLGISLVATAGVLLNITGIISGVIIVIMAIMLNGKKNKLSKTLKDLEPRRTPEANSDTTESSSNYSSGGDNKSDDSDWFLWPFFLIFDN